MSTHTPTPRVYAASRIASGVYIQPSNDGKRWFVIARYMDGRDFGWEDGPKRGTFWAWAPITEREIQNIISTAEDDDDALRELRYVATGHSSGFTSKREAVASALESHE